MAHRYTYQQWDYKLINKPGIYFFEVRCSTIWDEEKKKTP